MNSDESVAAIRAAVSQVGAKRIRRLVVTHIHPDHYGAAGTLAGDGGADLYLHRLEVALVNPRYVELEHLVKEVHAYLLVNGVPVEQAEVLSNSQRALSQVVKPAEPAVQLDGAELLRVGRRDLRVEWTPGHSPGHICLYDSGDKLLFADDHACAWSPVSRCATAGGGAGLAPSPPSRPDHGDRRGRRAQRVAGRARALGRTGQPLREAARAPGGPCAPAGAGGRGTPREAGQSVRRPVAAAIFVGLMPSGNSSAG